MNTANYNMTLWHSGKSEPIAARVALAGDFLPAGSLAFRPSDTWARKAAPVACFLADVDTTFANLESPLDCDGLEPRKVLGLGQTISAPPESLEYLKTLRAQAVGIANNHTFDFGEAGLYRTRNAIRGAGLVPIGSAHDALDAPQVHIWEGPAGIRVGFWAAASATREPATGTEVGVEPATLARGAAALAAMVRFGANFTVALVHAGTLRTNRPEPEDVRLLDSLARSGFDIIAASHSHRISGHRAVTRGDSRAPSFCFYGLGSIVSGYIASPEEREGLIVVAALTGGAALHSIEIRPVMIGASGFGAAPDLRSAHTILGRFSDLSSELSDGSFERMYYDEVSKDLAGVYFRDIRAAYRSTGLLGLAKKARRIRMRHVKRLVRKVAR